MITEDYVSFETAKLLKEKGFDEECRAFYVKSKECGIELFHAKESYNYNNNVHPCTSAPTIQMAMKWLREEHKMFICMLFLEDKDTYGFTIEHLVSKKYIATSKSDEYSSYEEACEAAIKYCLENLI